MSAADLVIALDSAQRQGRMKEVMHRTVAMPKLLIIDGIGTSYRCPTARAGRRLSTLDEAKRGELLYLRTRRAGGEREVVSLERLLRWEAGRPRPRSCRRSRRKLIGTGRRLRTQSEGQYWTYATPLAQGTSGEKLCRL